VTEPALAIRAPRGIAETEGTVTERDSAGGYWEVGAGVGRWGGDGVTSPSRAAPKDKQGLSRSRAPPATDA
jgi:hypothetical protein